MDAGRWLAQERGIVAVEEVLRPEAMAPPARYPLAERVPVEQLAALFMLRKHLPAMKNGLPTEVNSPLSNGLVLV